MKDNFLSGVAGGGENRYNVSTLRGLQEAHMAWVGHNFPAQLGEVTQSGVRELVFGKDVDPTRDPYSLIADAINCGDPRVVKRKHHGVLGALEELGELAHAFLKMEQGIRGGVDKTKWEAEAQDAVVDCIFFLISFCNTHGWDLDEMVLKTAMEVFRRDWVEYPGTGGPPSKHPGYIPEKECYDEATAGPARPELPQTRPMEPATPEGLFTEAFGMLQASLCPDMVVNVNDPLGMAQEIVNRVLLRSDYNMELLRLKKKTTEPTTEPRPETDGDRRWQGIERGLYWVSEFPQNHPVFKPLLANWVGDHWRTIATNPRYGDDRIAAGRVVWAEGPLRTVKMVRIEDIFGTGNGSRTYFELTPETKKALGL
jgi:hypothetical protein